MSVSQWARHSRKIVLLLLLSVFVSALLAGYIFILPIARYNHMYQPGAHYVYQMLLAYGRGHGGQFPESRADLIAAGYLHCRQQDETDLSGGWQFRTDTDGSFRDIPYFCDFDIAYGIELEDLAISGERLVRKSDHKEILLLRGPMKYMLPSFYRRLSVELYQNLRNYRASVYRSEFAWGFHAMVDLREVLCSGL